MYLVGEYFGFTVSKEFKTWRWKVQMELADLLFGFHVKRGEVIVCNQLLATFCEIWFFQGKCSLYQERHAGEWAALCSGSTGILQLLLQSFGFFLRNSSYDRNENEKWWDHICCLLVHPGCWKPSAALCSLPALAPTAWCLVCLCLLPVGQAGIVLPEGEKGSQNQNVPILDPIRAGVVPTCHGY